MKRDKKKKIILYSSLTGIGLITLASVTAWAVISKKNSQKINNNENPNNKQNNDINKPEVPNIDNKNPNEINEDKKLMYFLIYFFIILFSLFLTKKHTKISYFSPINISLFTDI